MLVPMMVLRDWSSDRHEGWMWRVPSAELRLINSFCSFVADIALKIVIFKGVGYYNISCFKWFWERNFTSVSIWPTALTLLTVDEGF